MNIGHAYKLPDVADGETLRDVCPMCGGGSTGERSLSCTREGVQVFFRCWRASCGFSGRLVSGACVPSTKQKPKARLHEITTVPSDQRALLEERVKSSSLREQAGLADLKDRRAFAFPVFRLNGTLAGHVLRTYEKGSFPKALTQLGEYRGCAWWSDTDNPRTVVIVEDIPSAAWLNDVTGIASCALMGSSLSEEKIRDILAARPESVIVCLDPDALSSAIDVANKLKARTDALVLVHHLPVDIKDMPRQDVSELGTSLQNMLEEKKPC